MSAEDARTLRFLRRLVTVLTLTMIAGVSTIVVLLVLRLNQPATALPLPDAIALPEDTRASAVTRTRDRLLVVTEDNALLVYSLNGREILQRIELRE